MVVAELPPEVVAKLDCDMRQRLGLDGLPLHKGNDYERHLFARRLKLLGKTRGETRQALIDLGLGDISISKRETYLNEVLCSILVGYGDELLAIYGEVG